LVTPGVAHHYPADPDIYIINYAIPTGLVLALDPDHIVILGVYGRRGLLTAPQFQARHGLLTRIKTHIYGSDGMLIFGRASRHATHTQRTNNPNSTIWSKANTKSTTLDAHRRRVISASTIMLGNNTSE